ncbi:MAG TPA: 7TM diverse intracellular signaling domain-containing protein [Ramlibacter sp.]|nr:7TM diverse intracellular signaling domain-containing protein [Ramlibacter sp.]
MTAYPQLRSVPVLLCAVLWLGLSWAAPAAPPAAARHILDLDLKTQPAQLLDWGDYVIDDSGTASLKEVLARPAQLRPTLPQSGYPLRPGQSLWIRFTVPATPDDQRWYVRIPNPGLDLATLHTLGSDDNWTQQHAGDSLPMSSWTLPHLYPVLPLAVSAADPTRYVLRVQASDGLNAPIEFVSESRLSWEQQRMSLLYGVFFGLLAMGAFFALATSVALRDSAYLWFGLWSACATLTAATAVGIAGLHFWPEAPQWSDAAHFALPAASAVAFVFFISQALLIRERAPRIFWLACALAAAATVCAFLAGWLASPSRLRLALSAEGVATMAGIGMAMWSWHHGDRFARNLLVALVPLALAVPLQWGAVIPGLGPATLAIRAELIALAATVCACYLLLALRSQEKRDHRRRIAQLHEVDPTTGLINDVVFAGRLRELIDRAQRFEHQSVVALVDFSNLPQLRSEFGRKQTLEVLLRLAERLNSMLRSIDTVARVGDARYGLLVDGPVAPSRARALCAKVIAHCIMPMSGLPQGMVVKPRIAMALVPGHGCAAQAVMEQLEGMLLAAAEDPTRIILLANTAATNPGPASAPASASAGMTIPSTQAGDTDFQATSAKQEADY